MKTVVWEFFFKQVILLENLRVMYRAAEGFIQDHDRSLKRVISAVVSCL